MPATTGQVSPVHDSSRPASWRTEIDGMRGIAVAYVIYFHLWGTGVSGGVDAFLVISGYLLTYGLLKKAATGKSLGVGSRLARIMRRLLGPQFLMVATISLVCAVIYPASRWDALAKHAWSSLASIQNVTLARESVDYYAQTTALASPFQHMWSLSIQGQVFLVLPIVFAAVYEAARRDVWATRAVFVIVLALVTVGSFGYAVYATRVSPESAYFSTWARLWEFTVGGLTAAWATRGALQATTENTVPAPSLLRQVVAAGGVIAFLATPFVFATEARFPGEIALLPTLGVAAFLWAARSPQGTATLAASLCTARPLTWIGQRAYGLYLWHWPLFMAYLTVSGESRPSVVVGLAIVAAAIALDALAMFALRLLAGPSTQGSIPRPQQVVYAVAVASVAVVGVSGATVYVGADRPGHHVLASAFGPSVGGAPLNVTPHPRDVPQEWQVPGELCKPGDAEELLVELQSCHVHHTGLLPSRRAVAVVGDSHGQQFLPPIMEYAASRDMDVNSYLLGGCRYPGVPAAAKDSELCTSYSESVAEEIAATQPKVVFMVGTIGLEAEPFEKSIDGLEEGLLPFLRDGIPVVLVRDNPRFAFNMFECGETRGWTAKECRASRLQETPASKAMHQLANNHSQVYAVDLNTAICPGGTCVPTQADVVVYMDTNHLTKTFSSTLSAMFSDKLRHLDESVRAQSAPAVDR